MKFRQGEFPPLEFDSIRLEFAIFQVQNLIFQVRKKKKDPCKIIYGIIWHSRWNLHDIRNIRRISARHLRIITRERSFHQASLNQAAPANRESPGTG